MVSHSWRAFKKHVPKEISFPSVIRYKSGEQEFTYNPPSSKLSRKELDELGIRYRLREDRNGRKHVDISSIGIDHPQYHLIVRDPEILSMEDKEKRDDKIIEMKNDAINSQVVYNTYAGSFVLDIEGKSEYLIDEESKPEGSRKYRIDRIEFPVPKGLFPIQSPLSGLERVILSRIPKFVSEGEKRQGIQPHAYWIDGNHGLIANQSMVNNLYLRKIFLEQIKEFNSGRRGFDEKAADSFFRFINPGFFASHDIDVQIDVKKQYESFKESEQESTTNP